MRLNKIQQAAVSALEDIKATDITPLDTRTLTSLYDAIIVATAESARQTKALARNVADKVRAAGGHVIAIEGEQSGEWVIVDCGELVVHIMLPQTRVLYHLEELWTPAPREKTPKPQKSIVKTTSNTGEKSRKIGASVRKGKAAAGKTVPAAAPAAKKPAAKPSTKSAARKTPEAKRPAVKKPAAKKPAAKSPASKRPAAKKPAVKRPAAKKPAAKKPAAKKPAAKKSSAK